MPDSNISCHYIVARFVPDEVRDEPINIGVILEPQTGDHRIHYKFLSSRQELKNAIPLGKFKSLKVIVKDLEGELADRELEPHFLENLSKRYNHSLQFTDVRGVLAKEPSKETDYLYNRLVVR